MRLLSVFWVPILVMWAHSACTSQKPAPESENSATFLLKSVPTSQSGINFQNTVSEQSETFNCFSFFNIYNGGGVALGDINNDGLPDIYFTANQGSNKLYLNKGKLEFDDITESANVTGVKTWTTGVTMADVNGDGWLDIFVCQSGPEGCEPESLQNLLFINNGDLTFTESAAAYGLTSLARTNHAVFFDYDRDGDLDLYAINHPIGFGDYINFRIKKAQNPKDVETDKLFRNEGGKSFTEVTHEAGLRNYGFGLSASVADFNNDGWPDLFVANDYSEPDHLYMNNGDGSFTDSVQGSFKHISQFSMGSDAADVNNDGRPDLVVVDMVAEDNRRKKINMQGMNLQAFYNNFALGRHLQYMQNMFQLNQGNLVFSEIGEMSGMAYTDWSWSPLLCDLNNDGFKDLYITNGIKKDLRNNDFQKSIAHLSSSEIKRDYKNLLAQMPSEPVQNYVFENNKNLQFIKQNKSWTNEEAGFSNGSAYADLDSDGDLDLVLNNMDAPATILENTSTGSNYLRIQLKGAELNTFGIGAKIKITCPTGENQLIELHLSHGFQSSSEPIAHFGLGNNTLVDTVQVIWPNQTKSTLFKVQSNQLITINQTSAKAKISALKNDSTQGFIQLSDLLIDEYQHYELFYEDYDREILLPHRYSQLGPFVSVADVNGDNLQDFFVGGAAEQSGLLYLHEQSGQFKLAENQPWLIHAKQEDLGSVFFDIDNDGDQDLYVCSGSNQWESNSTNYADRVYINDGTGVFAHDPTRLPVITASSQKVIAADFDNDGDLDLFVGGRVEPGQYPYAPQSHLLINENGYLKDKTTELAPELERIGMVTDALWVDTDQDTDLDLVIVGEWMPITVFENNNGLLQNSTTDVGLSDELGWWYCLEAGDFDNDGDLDFIAGNLGLNSKYQTTEGSLEVYAGDLDNNGTHDIVLGYHSDGSCFPVRGRTCSSQQMPSVAKKIPSYNLFGESTVFDVYGQELESAYHKKANVLASSYIENLGGGEFKVSLLPIDAQLSAVNAIVVKDFNGDGNLDALIAGNNHSAEIETARHDAAIGLLLLGDGKGDFTPVSNSDINLYMYGDVKDLKSFEINGKPHFIKTENHAALQFFCWQGMRQEQFKNLHNP